MKKILFILLVTLVAGVIHGQPGRSQPLEEEHSRYESLLRRTQEAVATCDNVHAQRLLNQAEQETKKISSPRRPGERREIRAHYANATRLLLRALDLCSESSRTNKSAVREEFSRLEEEIDRTRRKASTERDENRRPFLDRLSALESQTRDALEADQPEVARRKMDLIRSLLQLDTHPGPWQSKARQELIHLQREIDRMRSSSAEFSPRARILLRAAENQAADAEQLLQRRRIRPALAAIVTGNRLLSRVDKTTPLVDTSAALLERELQTLEEKLNSLADETGADTAQQDDIRLCRHACQKARQALADQQIELAHEYVNLARELANDLNI